MSSEKEREINLRHAIFIFENEMGRKPDITNEKDTATVAVIELGVRYAMAGNLLTKQELGAFHDVVYDVTERDFSLPTLHRIWIHHVPENLKSEALHWGADDSVVRDNLYDWVTDNLEAFDKYESQSDDNGV